MKTLLDGGELLLDEGDAVVELRLRVGRWRPRVGLDWRAGRGDAGVAGRVSRLENITTLYQQY